MRKIIYSVFFLLLLFVTYAIVEHLTEKDYQASTLKTQPGNQEGEIPSDWFFTQRAYPAGKIDHEAYFQAVSEASKAREAKRSEKSAMWGSWVFAGPENIGGRINDIEMHASDQQTIFLGTASGGVFRSTNAGVNWTPIFDDQPSLSIGDMAIAPSNKNIIYVGTGEPNAGGGSITYDGNGIYRSSDGGNTWVHKGLDNGRSTGKVVVHPTNPDIVFTAQMGNLFGDNNDRGIFKTTDGGTTWQKVLFVSDSTGGIDLVINPAKPDTLYAAMWERVRRHNRRTYGGATSAIYRSYDGGANWTKLTNGLPSGSNVGRIGIDISRSSPSILYAVVADKAGAYLGGYKTSNNGDTWTSTATGSLNNNFNGVGWWFSKIFVHPTNSSKVYTCGLSLYESVNSGSTWSKFTTSLHADQHCLFIHPQNINLCLLANDGGLYISTNTGATWNHVNNLPITQFNTCEVDFTNPTHLYGGTQDNHVIRTSTGQLDDWTNITNEDGFVVLVDPTNSNTIYACTQYGALERSTNGGTSTIPILSGITYSTDRKNWCTPVVMDPTTSSTLYYGSQRLYKTINKGTNWTPISTDLTKGIFVGSSVYATISAIAVSKSNSNVVYVGTDDAKVWRTIDGGTTWNDLSSGLPDRYVTRIAVDPLDAQKAFVTFSGYKHNDPLAHVFKTTDGGSSWQDISSNLPNAPVNDVIIDPQLPNVLYVATDVGVYYTLDLGINWDILGDQLPNVPITDLTLHNPTRYLVAATYGRSMYKYDLGTTVSLNDPAVSPDEVIVFPNPFRDVLNIHCSAPDASVEILDLKGRRVKMLHRNPADALSWDGKNEEGAEQPAGVYFCIVKRPLGTREAKVVFKR